MLLQLIWINQQYMDLHQTQFQRQLKIHFLVLHGPTSAPINTGAQNTVVNTCFKKLRQKYNLFLALRHFS